jgi:hypothetical protein
MDILYLCWGVHEDGHRDSCIVDAGTRQHNPD